VKTSTKWLFKKHGWRLDRTLHNYIYYRFYYPYVKVLYRFCETLFDAVDAVKLEIPEGFKFLN